MVQYIETNNIERLKILLSIINSKQKKPSVPEFHIDEHIFSSQMVTLSALSYAFRIGNLGIFRYLLEKYNASLVVLFVQYRKYSRTPMESLWESGNIELFKYFLPIYEKFVQTDEYKTQVLVQDPPEDASTIGAKTLNQFPAPIITHTSLMRAVEKGRMDMVRHVKSYFTGTVPLPEFDFMAEDERSGDTWGHIAARMGNLKILQFLYKKWGVQLKTKLNKRKENALQLACIGSKKHKEVDYMPVIRYLVEIVGIDIRYEPEEMLLTLLDPSIIDYLERRLTQLDVHVTKQQVDSDNQFGKRPPGTENQNLSMEERLKDLTTHFEFQEVFSKELAAGYDSSQVVEMSPSLSASMISVPSQLEIHSQPLLTPDELDVSLSDIHLVTEQSHTKDITIR